eukprot:CAMPEP_0206553546 /NCGR_PEP_ID=MMETSP0325_2-20121206/16690_1 /ASSEMBLY_ACC=CAM_ASM_000347 /TAXON_ID=2866 /ORGANISM="Crypthecodinium cohnii, Strain Seligo" /LENGTH=124 /DNA_ID=CAMNT_0054053531 /DNA_START=568 /DNA_END=938 /DNA_ORIENTATION=-
MPVHVRGSAVTSNAGKATWSKTQLRPQKSGTNASRPGKEAPTQSGQGPGGHANAETQVWSRPSSADFFDIIIVVVVVLVVVWEVGRNSLAPMLRPALSKPTSARPAQQQESRQINGGADVCKSS